AAGARDIRRDRVGSAGSTTARGSGGGRYACRRLASAAQCRDPGLFARRGTPRRRGGSLDGGGLRRQAPRRRICSTAALGRRAPWSVVGGRRRKAKAVSASFATWSP